MLFYNQAEIDHHQAWPSKAGYAAPSRLRIIYAHEKVIGIDITGECSATLDYFSELEDAEINNEANEELLRMILEENHP